MVTFTSIDQSIARGDADIGLSGIEDTPARRADAGGHDSLLPVPRGAERPRRRRRTASGRSPIFAADASATLGGTIAYEILLRAEREHGLRAVSYDDDVHPYTDLVLGPGRRRAARQRARRAAAADDAGIHHPAGRRSRSATTSASSRRPTRRCATRSTSVLRTAMRDGIARAHLPQVERLERRSAARFTRKLLAGEAVPPVLDGACRHVDRRRRRCRGWEAARRYLPSLLRASVVTLVLSCLSMGLAVVARRADRDRARLRRRGRCDWRSSATSS